MRPTATLGPAIKVQLHGKKSPIVARLVTVKSIERDEGNDLEAALGRRAAAL